jgi:hypothetical protein
VSIPYKAKPFSALLRDYAAKTADRKASQLLRVAAAKIDELENHLSESRRQSEAKGKGLTTLGSSADLSAPPRG